MITNHKIKQTIDEVEILCTEINNKLNKNIAENENSEDKKALRIIRDKNIDTFLKIKELKMVGLI